MPSADFPKETTPALLPLDPLRALHRGRGRATPSPARRARIPSSSRGEQITHLSKQHTGLTIRSIN
eukprot:7625744-Pyramimonas_sp.AAC.1